MTDWADPAEPTLADALDRLLARGVVVKGELWLTVADVELLFIGAHVVIANPDTVARRDHAGPRPCAAPSA